MTQSLEDVLIRELRPVTFRLVQDDGQLAVFRALVGEEVKSTTVLSLTATTASPGDGPKRTALLEFLNEIRAAFAVLDKPGSPDPVTTEPEPFDPLSEVMIELGLARSADNNAVSCAVAVQATMPGSKITVRYGRAQVWSTGSSNQAWAHLTIRAGAGTVHPQVQVFIQPNTWGKWGNGVNANHRYRTYSNQVTVSTGAQMTYILYGNSFRLQSH